MLTFKSNDSKPAIAHIPPVTGWPPVKAVIGGSLFDTSSSTLIHEVVYPSAADDDPHPYTEQLYRSRYHKHFLACIYTPTLDGDLRHEIRPLTQHEAILWMENNGCSAVKITKWLNVPLAADPGCNLNLVLDNIQKILINMKALKDGKSLNAWCVDLLSGASNAAIA